MPNLKVQDRKIIYLNTKANCSKTVSTDTTKNLEFTWRIPSVKIDDLAHLSVLNFQHEGTGDGNHILTFLIKDIQYNTRNYYSTNNISSSILISASLQSTATYWSGDNFGITLTPQMINTITIIASDTLNDPFSGVATTLKFVFCLSIEEFDVKLTPYGNPYGEARVDNLNNKLY